MVEETHDIVIVGGGICGLATALALHRKGIKSLVLEKSETLRAEGGYIGLHVNGWRVMDQLGIAPELRKTCNDVSAYHDAWHQGKKSRLTPVSDELRFVKRKDLVESMAKYIPEGTIRFGYHIAAIRPADPGAVVTTSDGRVIRAKVLIGCDGTHSMVAKYIGLSAARSTPTMYMRGFTRYPNGHPFPDDFLRLRIYPGFVGRAAISDNLVSFFVACPITPEDAKVIKDGPSTRHFVLERLQSVQCPAEILEMIQNSNPEELVVTTKVWYRPPWEVAFAGFRKGTVTVAGDAMHTMGSYIGQGGAMAMEDGLVLARSLARNIPRSGGRADETCDDKAMIVGASRAIAEYISERRLRVARLSLESFSMGRFLQTKWLAMKLLCLAILLLLGTDRTLGHTKYDCGRL